MAGGYRINDFAGKSGCYQPYSFKINGFDISNSDNPNVESIILDKLLFSKIGMYIPDNSLPDHSP